MVSVTFFAPVEIIGLAYDSGGVTTSTVTVPLVAALGIGLSSSIKGRNPAIDGFGLIAFASLTPMIFVQVFGIIVYNFGSTGETAVLASGTVQAVVERFGMYNLLLEFLGVIKDVAPILLVIAFFQYLIIKKPIPHLKKVIVGVVLLIIGLDAFIVGLELGLFPIGESIAYALTGMGNNYLIYLFGFMIGFSTTMAEPAH